MKVKDILSDESMWTQGAAARERWGEPCPPSSPMAAKYCILGAIYRAYSKPEDRIAAANRVKDAINNLGWRCNHPINIGNWNDYPSRTFEDVKKVLERADI
jgi:hypothetical protein